MDKLRLCVSCAHLGWSRAQPEYSEYTPGSDVEIYCQKGHWQMDNYASLEAFRAQIAKAQTCPEFEDANG